MEEPTQDNTDERTPEEMAQGRAEIAKREREQIAVMARNSTMAFLILIDETLKEFREPDTFEEIKPISPSDAEYLANLATAAGQCGKMI